MVMATACYPSDACQMPLSAVPAFAGGFPAIFIAAEAEGLGTLRSGTAGPLGPDDVDAIDVAHSPNKGNDRTNTRRRL